MAQLVPCKSCNHQVAKTVKTCHHCGTKSPSMTWKNHLATAVFFIVVVTILMRACSPEDDPVKLTEPSPLSSQEAKPVEKDLSNVPVLTAAEIDQHIVEISTIYMQKVSELVNAYKSMKDLPREKFILWRLNEWQPPVLELRHNYADLLEKNRKVLYESGGFDMITVFNAFVSLDLAGLNIMISLRDDNNENLALAKKQIKDDITTFEKVASTRGITISGSSGGQ